MEVESRTLAEKCNTMQKLQDELTKALEAKGTAEQNQRVLEDQLNAQEMLRTSRLGFVTEVWALHKMLLEAMQNTKGKTRKANTSRSPRSNGDVTEHLQRMTCICKRSKLLIDRYLTDAEIALGHSIGAL